MKKKINRYVEGRRIRMLLIRFSSNYAQRSEAVSQLYIASCVCLIDIIYSIHMYFIASRWKTSTPIVIPYKLMVQDGWETRRTIKSNVSRDTRTCIESIRQYRARLIATGKLLLTFFNTKTKLIPRGSFFSRITAIIAYLAVHEAKTHSLRVSREIKINFTRINPQTRRIPVVRLQRAVTRSRYIKPMRKKSYTCAILIHPVCSFMYGKIRRTTRQRNNQMMLRFVLVQGFTSSLSRSSLWCSCDQLQNLYISRRSLVYRILEKIY